MKTWSLGALETSDWLTDLTDWLTQVNKRIAIQIICLLMLLKSPIRLDIWLFLATEIMQQPPTDKNPLEIHGKKPQGSWSQLI